MFIIACVCLQSSRVKQYSPISSKFDNKQFYVDLVDRPEDHPEAALARKSGTHLTWSPGGRVRIRYVVAPRR